MIMHIKGIAAAAYTQVEQRVLREFRRCCTIYSSLHDSSSQILCTSLQGSKAGYS